MYGSLLKMNPREIYSMDVTETGITLTVRTALVSEIMSTLKNETMLATLLSIKRIIELECTTFVIILPYITFPNYAHKKLNWRALGICAEQMSTLLELVNNYFFPLVSVDEEFYLSNKRQMILISTNYSKERDMHACPIELGFSEIAAKNLEVRFQKDTVCNVAISKGTMTYLLLTETRWRNFVKQAESFKKNQGDMFGVQAYVRASGIPQFYVPGSCACLGENPDTFRYSRGMYTHNLDTTLQQMTMIVVIVSFWNEVVMLCN